MKLCDRCDKDKNDHLFDKGIEWCKRCINDVSLTPIPKNIPKNYEQYREVDRKRRKLDWQNNLVRKYETPYT